MRSTTESPASDAPLDTPRPAGAGLYVVDSVMRGPLGLPLPVRMAVIRLSGGDLVLYSPTRLVPELRDAVMRIGRVRHLVAPSTSHWTFVRQWQDSFPDAITWAAPGLRHRRQVRQSKVRLDHDLAAPPPEWEGIELTLVPGGMGYREAALFHGPSRTLLLTDLVMNLRPWQVPRPLLPVLRLLGLVNGKARPPVYLRALIRLRAREAAGAARRLLALEPEQVVFAHGPWFAHDATGALRRSLGWLLPDEQG
jgi:hypothetical protein